MLADIEKLLTRRIERQVVAGFEPGQAPPPQVLAAAAAQPTGRGGRDHNRHSVGHAKDSLVRSPSAATLARPGTPASTPSRSSPPPQRSRADAGAPLPALFRSPARRGG